jgi:Lipocalin-like domain
LPDRAFRQQNSLKDLLVGTWLQVSVDVTSTDGTRRALFGDNPKGIVIYTNDGYFSLMQARTDLPKLASGRPATATLDEAKGGRRRLHRILWKILARRSEQGSQRRHPSQYVRQSSRRPDGKTHHNLANRQRTAVYQTRAPFRHNA